MDAVSSLPSAAARAPKQRRWILLSSGIGALIGAEMVLRFLGFGYPLLYRASDAGYELVESQSSTRLGKTTHINALGFRGPEVSRMPEPGVTRIMLLGDSIVNGGALISDGETIGAQLQQVLSKSRKVEVVTAAAGGWSLPNEAAWVREHGFSGSHQVLVSINDKDLDQAFVGSNILDSNVSFPSRPPITSIGEVLSRYLLPRLGLREASDPGSSTKQPGLNQENVPAVIAAVDSIVDSARAAAAAPKVLYWDIRTPPDGDTKRARESLFVHLRRQGVEVIRPQLARRPNASDLFRDNVHPNAKGNREAARVIATSY